jgi:hypothetical protein
MSFGRTVHTTTHRHRGVGSLRPPPGCEGGRSPPPGSRYLASAKGVPSGDVALEPLSTAIADHQARKGVARWVGRAHHTVGPSPRRRSRIGAGVGGDQRGYWVPRGLVHDGLVGPHRRRDPWAISGETIGQVSDSGIGPMRRPPAGSRVLTNSGSVDYRAVHESIWPSSSPEDFPNPRPGISSRAVVAL